MAKTERYYGTGRRKTSVARVYLVPGKGSVTINKRDMDDYFGMETLKVIVRQPLEATNNTEKFDVLVKVIGAPIHRTGGCCQTRHRESVAPGRPRLQTYIEESRLPDERSSYEGEKEVRPEGCEKGTSVLQEMTSGIFQSPEHICFGDFVCFLYKMPVDI